MEPTNDRERAIAQAVDKNFLEYPGNGHHAIIRDVAESLNFAMSASDSQFLVSYLEWLRSRSTGTSKST